MVTILIGACAVDPTSPMSSDRESTPGEDFSDCSNDGVFIEEGVYDALHGWCEMAEPVEAVCASDEVEDGFGWWSGPGCPDFEEYVERQKVDQHVACDGPWSTWEGYVRACAASDGGRVLYQAFFDQCEVDTCRRRDATFDSDGALETLHLYSGSIDLSITCCSGTWAWNQRFWGEMVALDCTDAVDYLPSDLASCGGAGLP
jgi:hypothetical protein